MRQTIYVRRQTSTIDKPVDRELMASALIDLAEELRKPFKKNPYDETTNTGYSVFQIHINQTQNGVAVALTHDK